MATRLREQIERLVLPPGANRPRARELAENVAGGREPFARTRRGTR